MQCGRLRNWTGHVTCSRSTTQLNGVIPARICTFLFCSLWWKYFTNHPVCLCTCVKHSLLGISRNILVSFWSASCWVHILCGSVQCNIWIYWRNLTCGVTQYLPGPYNNLVLQTGWDSCSSLLTVNAVLRDYLC